MYPQHLELTMLCSKWQTSIYHGKAQTFVFSKLQGRHTNMEPWCECRNINDRWKTPVFVYLWLVLKWWQSYISCSSPFVTTLLPKWKTGFHYECDIYLPYLNIQVIIWHKKWFQQYIQILVQNTWNRKLLQSNYKISLLCWTINQEPQMCKMQCW